MELGEFDIQFQSRQAVKAQVLADFLIECKIVVDDEAFQTETLMLHIDGSSIASNGGTRIFFQGPNNFELEVVLKLDFEMTNIEAEYEALTIGLKLAQMQERKLIAYTDSQLIAMQVESSYEAKERIMIYYLNRVKQLIEGLEDFKLCQIPRAKYKRADTLAKFASMVIGVRDKKVVVITSDQLRPSSRSMMARFQKRYTT